MNKVCIFGLGRIGLPISLVSADSGYHVVGIDINKELVDNLKRGVAPFEEPHLAELLQRNINKRFFPMVQNEAKEYLKNANYILVCVGTEFTRYPKKPMLDRLFKIVDNIIDSGLKGKTVIMRVTLPIGTLDKVKERMESKSGLKEGVDFYLGFVPERLMEGKAIEEEKSLPKIVGTYSDSSFEKIREFFSKIGGEIVRVSSPRTAEFIKLIDNAWRNLKFSFANELAYLAEENGIDVLEAIKKANRGYKRNRIPIPGPVSGYCLGKDPYLLELAFESIEKKRGFNSVWYYGRRTNDWMLEKVADEVVGKRVLIAGLTFKRDIDDFRYSFGLYLVEELLNRGLEVYVHDPFLNRNYYTRLPESIASRVKVCESIEECVGNVDTLIFATNHSSYYNIDLLHIDKSLNHRLRVLDLWNIFYLQKERFEHVEYLGFGVRR